MSGAIRESELAPGVLRWTLDNQPKRNALTPAMLAHLERRAGELRGEVVVLDAEGPCFCAGFDFDALPERQVSEATPDDPLIRASTALQAADAVTIAVIHGDTFGAGVELAAACDLRLAAPGVRFVLPAARLGVIYHPRGVHLLLRVFGPALARRLLLAADEVSADDVARAGGIAGLYPPAELLAAAVALAGRIHLGARHSVQAHRDLLRALERGGLDPAVEAAYALARRAAFSSDEFRERREAALARRSARGG